MSTDALAIISTRRSTRKFTTDPVVDADIRDLLEAAMNAPSAVNEQAWQFVVLSGKALEDYLKINSNTPKGALVAILVCQDLAAEKAKGYSVQDCAAATQNLLLSAHALGFGGVWVGVHPKAEREKGFRDLLKIPEHVVPFALVPLGIPAEKTGQVPRFRAERIHEERW